MPARKPRTCIVKITKVSKELEMQEEEQGKIRSYRETKTFFRNSMHDIKR